MSPRRVEFLVESSLPRDSGANKAVVSPGTLDELDWSSGGFVEIRGTEKAVATLASSRSDEAETRSIRLDVFTRVNGGVSVDDTVEAEVIEPGDAEMIEVSVPDETASFEIAPDEIRRRLMGEPVMESRYVPIQSIRDNPRQSVALLVDETRPEGTVIVSEDTEIRLERTNEI